MLASIQYLLAGLPVVTTPSLGGRDVFFDPAHSLTVKPDPAAVAAGVREMINRNVPREEIRARAIQEMERHRARLVAYVARITGEQESSDPLARWQRWAAFNSGRVNVGQLLEQLRHFR
jgi:glycosyltransferase involved in cell wall biosynthesis